MNQFSKASLGLPSASGQGGQEGAQVLRPHEFFLVRYLPDVVRGEFINIGVVIRERVDREGVNARRQARVRIAPDYNRIRGVFPEVVDLRFLASQESIFREWLTDVASDENVLSAYFDKIKDQLSLTIQLTDPQPCLTSDIDAELTALMAIYVDPAKSTVTRDPRSLLYTALEEAPDTVRRFECAEQYTELGDTLQFDYIYKTEGVTHIVQSVCVADGIDPVLALAARVESLAKGIREVEGTSLEITVVTELPPEHEQPDDDAYLTYQLAVSILRASGITVRNEADLPLIAKEIAGSITL